MKQPFQSPTIKEVASLAGVAVSTVSLALRHHPKVREATRQRVEEAAATLGYRRNAAFATLGTRTRRRSERLKGLPIAWLFTRRPNAQATPYEGFWDGAISAAERLGYDLHPHEIRAGEPLAPLLKMLYARGVVGIVVEYFKDADPILAADWSPFAVVCCGLYHTELPFHTVRDSKYLASRHAYKELWGLGYRRIGLATMMHDLPQIDDGSRIGGALSLAYRPAPDGKIPRPIPPCVIPQSKWQTSMIATWLKRHRPDAVIGFPWSLAYEIHASGFEMPGDVAFCGFSMKPSVADRFQAARIEVYREEMGDAAIEWLDQLVRLGERDRPRRPRSMIIASSWCQGQLPRFSPPLKRDGSRLP